MRKIFTLIALSCVAAFALSACDKGEAPVQQAAEQAPTILPAPTNPDDKDAWKKYLVSAVTANMEGVKTSRPYMYFVPGGEDETAVTDRANQLENVRTVVSRGVLPGNMMAFGGPDSHTTAKLVVDAFADAQPGSFKDVIVLFIGTSADFEEVKTALAASGAVPRFVEVR